MSTEIRGVTASDGLFMGPVRRLAQSLTRRSGSGDAASERDALQAAIGLAVAELSDLMGRIEADAAGVLGFQVAMLEDDALSAPALAAIAAGAAADAAWVEAMNAEIAGYADSDDDYFRARAADLEDMRDRVLRLLSGERSTAVAGGTVLVGEDLAPTAFLETDWSNGGAIALMQGSAASHVAMLARARGVPMVVGLGPDMMLPAEMLIVDGTRGLVIGDPDAKAQSEFHRNHGSMLASLAVESKFSLEPARRKDGSPIELLINVAGVDELPHIDVKCCDGIGLMRSEFLFRDGAPLPGEEQQYRCYRRFLEWAEGRPVTIRTLDIGGDKPVGGLTATGQSNPFLGVRGVRLTLARQDVFRVQLRALARAAVHGKLKIMLPMVTVPEELSRSAALLDTCVGQLQGEGIACARPPIGIMVEVPAVAIAPELFREAAFFSIGSNDLTQYVTASSRDDAQVAALNDCGHPAVARLIRSVTCFGYENDIPVSLCGDMASDIGYLRLLLAAGLTSLSVAPSRIARIKAALAEM